MYAAVKQNLLIIAFTPSITAIANCLFWLKKKITIHFIAGLFFVVCVVYPVVYCLCSLVFIGLFILLQATQQQTGSMHVQQERNDVHIQNTKHWNWKKNFFITCIWQEIAVTKLREFWIWPKGRWRSGSKTEEWKWKRWTERGVARKLNE